MRQSSKTSSHVFDPRIGFYYEHELTGDRPLLDLRVDLALGREWYLRAGQFKVLYNRERVDSSGKQQFVDRSIANDAFTLDRQRGVNLFKRLAAGSAASSWLVEPNTGQMACHTGMMFPCASRYSVRASQSGRARASPMAMASRSLPDIPP